MSLTREGKGSSMMAYFFRTWSCNRGCRQRQKRDPPMDMDEFYLHERRNSIYAARSKIHFQNVEPAAEAVDRVDDLALVDEAIVELNRADR